MRQRVYQIVCGYEDQNDATTVRTDPLLKLVCGRMPDRPADLASQPTLWRLENAVSARTCYRLAQALLDVYLQEREHANGDRPPAHVLLDLDGTDDPTHDTQEGSAYHGAGCAHWAQRRCASTPCGCACSSAPAQVRLLTIGGWVRHQADGFRLHLASSHPAEPLWRLLMVRFQSP